MSTNMLHGSGSECGPTRRWRSGQPRSYWTVFKAILGLEGTGKETKLDLPDLAKKVNIALGLDDQGTRGDEPGAKQRRGVLKGLNSIVAGIGEIRNEGFGTGHGVYRRPELDVATARLVVTAASAAATFYIEAYAAADDDTI